MRPETRKEQTNLSQHNSLKAYVYTDVNYGLNAQIS